MANATCRCGRNRMPTGQCPHCDVLQPASCPKSCAHCVHRDSHCVVCKTYRGTPAAAQTCAETCRLAEAKAEREQQKKA
ncbi:hypothetical protein [Cellulomonas rhizosphaerae]|uniref:Uncharacterized protein n=1 Tax=Cellulomonas rhizosphaerae TaxID=2293719 RepID=A0A413RJH6_9CELL|nr:hypothetical protein [Cellulomonas rhizosphaerae]RHA38727.1 hypothetical protein D1825_13415 [Cellulomonas rhizosphaerae]